MKKVLVIGDTHGNIKKMLKIIKQEHADYVIHAGDYDDVNINDKNHPYHKLNRNILKKYFSYWTKGNHDFTVKYGPAKTQKDFENFIFKAYRIFKIDGITFFLSHFVDNSRNEIGFGDQQWYIKNKKFVNWLKKIIKCEHIDFIITGHTHVAKYWNMFNLPALNPGSLVAPKHDQFTGSYATFLIKNHKIHDLKINFVD